MDSKLTRAAHIANILTFVLTLVTVILTVLSLWQNWPASESAPNAGFLMTTWAIPAALITALLISALFHLIAVIIARRHSATSDLSSSSATLKCVDGWLHDIAFEQSKAIEDYIAIDCWILKHRLIGDEPYIDFRFYLTNRSVFSLSLMAVNGFIHYGPERLKPSPIITENSIRSLTAKQPEGFTVSQSLRPSDAVLILNHVNWQFGFTELHVNIETSPGPHSFLLSEFPSLAITEDFITRNYPKLSVIIQSASFSVLFDQRRDNSETGIVLVTLEIGLESARESAIEIDKFKVVTTLKGKSFTTYAATQEKLWTRQYIDTEGVTKNLDQRELDNLNFATPLILERGNTLRGALQFTFGEMNYSDEMLNQIEGQPFTLYLIDKTGEEHSTQGSFKWAQ